MRPRAGRPALPTAALALAAIVFLAAGLRFAGLGSQALWWDEGWSIYFASLPLGRMLAATAVDIHPPLYYAILHAWSAAFGYSPLAVRAFSLLCSLALVAGVYALGHRLGGRRLAFTASLLAALAPLQVYYSQEARMYAFLAALAVWSWVALLAAAGDRGGRPRDKALYVLLTAAALYTEYYAALLWAGQAVYLLLAYTRDRRRPRALTALLLAAPIVAYLPWLIYAVPKLIAYVADKQSIEGYSPLGPLAYTWSYLSTFAAGHRLAGQSPALWGLGVAGGGTLAALGLLWADRALRRLALCLLAVPLLGGYAVNVLYPFTPAYFERVLLFASVPLCLLAAATVCRLANRGTWPAVGALAVAALPALGLPYLWTTPRYADGDYRPVFAEVRRYGSQGDAILCVHPWQYGYALAYLPPGQFRPLQAPVDAWSDAATRRRALATIAADYLRVWFPAHQSLGRILESEIAADLDGLGYRALSGWHGSETLLLAYAGWPATVAGATGALAPGIALAGSLYAPAAAVGGTATAVLDWGETATDGLTVSLRLVDGNGTVWAAHDGEIDGRVQRLGLLVPWGTPATTLSLAVVLSRGGVELEPESALSGHTEVAIGEVAVRPAAGPAPAAVDLGYTAVGAASPDGLELAGVGAPPKAVRQGDDVPIELWWSSDAAVSREYVVYLQALDASGTVVAATEARVTGGIWPPTAWPAGTLVRDPQSLALPAHTPPGGVRILAGLLDPATRQPLPLGGKAVVEVGRVRVDEVARSFVPPAAAIAASVRFGALATLVGYDAPECRWQGGVCLTDASALVIDLVWQAQAETGVRYRSFVHVLCGSEIVAQSVQQPGNHATTAWLPGEYVVDSHALALPQGLCGEAAVAVGLYDPATGERLPPSGAAAPDGRAVLFTVARP